MVLTNYGNVVNPNHERKNLPLRDGLCDFGDHLWHWVYYKKRDMNHKLWTCFFLTVNLSHETTVKLSVFRRWRFYQHVWIVVVSDKRQVGSRVSFLFEFHPVNGLIPIQTFNDFSKMPTKLAKNWRYTKHFRTLFNRPEAWTLQSSRPFSKSHPTKELGFGITKKIEGTLRNMEKKNGETTDELMIHTSGCMIFVRRTYCYDLTWYRYDLMCTHK